MTNVPGSTNQGSKSENRQDAEDAKKKNRLLHDRLGVLGALYVKEDTSFQCGTIRFATRFER